MENFFKWMSQSIPKEEVTVWFNIHNMNIEKIELFGDFIKTLNQFVIDTYLGEDTKETRILLSDEDMDSHFEWCWSKTLENFAREKIFIDKDGEHKNYFKEFFFETFYKQSQKEIKSSIPNFLETTFDLEKSFTKSDLDILTELYKLLEKNIK